MVGIVARALPQGEAEDVVAEAFADAWAHATETDVDILTRYVWACVWHGVADCHRRGRHLRETELDPRRAAGRERGLRAAEARADISRAWPYLTARQQTALVRHFIEGQPYADIAADWGITEEGARRAAFRGWETARRVLTGKVR